MQAYLVGLLVLGVVCAVVEYIAPAGEGGGLGKHIKLMGALCFLCMLLVPLQALMEDGKSIPDRLQEIADRWQDLEGEEEDFADRWQAESEAWDLEYAGATIAVMLCEKFSQSSEDIRVTPILAEDGTTLDELRVALTGRAIWVNTHEMEDYIKTTFGCSSTIYIE